MKKYCVSILMAALAIVCVTTFVSCGGDDDESTPGTETGNITVGTHRIDVSFEGNTSGWTTTVAFSAVKASATGMGAKLYEGGQELTTEGGSWIDNKFRNYSVSTDEKCQSLLVVVYCRRNAHATAEPITVHLKGFIDGKQQKEQSIVADGSHATRTIFFYSQISEADRVQDLDY